MINIGVRIRYVAVRVVVRVMVMATHTVNPAHNPNCNP